jgi:hypothetical protein
MSDKEAPGVVQEQVELAPQGLRAQAHGQLGAAHLFIGMFLLTMWPRILDYGR